MSTSGKKSSIAPIILEDVSKHYIAGDNVIKALNNVSIDFNPGEFVMIMGPSGSGKSTLLSLIASLELPSTGKVQINGQDTRLLTDDQLCDLRRSNFGIVFQTFNLHQNLTARQNVEMPMLIAGIPIKERKIRSEELIKLVGLSDRALHEPGELSGGEQQRIAIARALANDPSILLADEPTGHLDTESGQKIKDLLIKLNKQYSKNIVLVTHDESLITPGMRLLKMQDGKIISNENTHI